jgi:polyferredoxin
MSFDQLSSIVARVLFALAFLLLGLAILERLVNQFGYTIFGDAFTGGRLLEIATTFAVFVIALLLRQIREALREQAS